MADRRRRAHDSWGRPLVKNATFLQAQREGAPADSLHDDYWEPTFEADDYWLEEVRQGREKRARADWFLMHWLAMELGDVTRADKLFDTFRKVILHRPGSPATTELILRLCEDARIMRSFDDFEPGTPEASSSRVWTRWTRQRCSRL
jgi:hypothetical protein